MRDSVARSGVEVAGAWQCVRQRQANVHADTFCPRPPRCFLPSLTFIADICSCLPAFAVTLHAVCVYAQRFLIYRDVRGAAPDDAAGCRRERT